MTKKQYQLNKTDREDKQWKIYLKKCDKERREKRSRFYFRLLFCILVILGLSVLQAYL